MNKKELRIILTIICIIIILFTIYKIIDTYALFQSQAIGIVKGDIGNWNIIINGTNITSGVNKEFEINEINIEENNNVKANKFAPGTIGSFYITIIPEDTDVSIKYTINIDDTLLQEQKIKMDSVEEIQDSNTLICEQKNTYTGIIPLEKIKNGINNKIKFSISWENDEAFNENDTSLGSVWNAKVKIPITINVTQFTDNK